MFYDDDNGVLFLTGKGNGTIDFFEVSNSELFHLGNYKAKESGSAYADLPKRCMDVRNCEIMRILQLAPNGQVLPIKFMVPRRENQFFQDGKSLHLLKDFFLNNYWFYKKTFSQIAQMETLPCLLMNGLEEKTHRQQPSH